jgi:predicted nucleic acid-binding Zn ribbon protein
MNTPTFRIIASELHLKYHQELVSEPAAHMVVTIPQTWHAMPTMKSCQNCASMASKKIEFSC